MTKPHLSTPRVVPQQQQTASRIKSPRKLRHSARLSHDAESLKTHLQFLNTTTKDPAKPAAIKPKTSSRDRNEHAELYRMDLIRAMRIPEVLTDYLIIQEPWKPDWERGVQVPVNDTSSSLPNVIYNPVQSPNTSTMNETIDEQDEFSMPKKYLCPIDHKLYNGDVHESYSTHRKLNNKSSDSTISKYDFDEADYKWIRKVNDHLRRMDEEVLTTGKFEKLIELLETQANTNLKTFLENLKNYNIEFDEEIVCDVCRAPDSECDNEMVFCDGCNVCVHQACYGIEKIPTGTWLCTPCTLGGVAFKPDCLLCPNKGGAMKPTRNMTNWCHVSCALWIPEISFGNPLKLEPIANINKIPTARWQLTCSLCKVKAGCCIQCSEKKCMVAFHITCAFKHSLLIEQIVADDKVISKCFCLEHSNANNASNDQSVSSKSPIKSNGNTPLKKSPNKELQSPVKEEEEENILITEKSFLASLQAMTDMERKHAIVNRVEKIYSRFYQNIDLAQIKQASNIKSQMQVELVFNYWKLKRRFNVPPNKALMSSRNVDDLMNQTENILTMRKNMFMNLRLDLERLRNLCYLVSRREKQKRQYNEINRGCFSKQVEYLNKYKANTGNHQLQAEPTEPVSPNLLMNHALQLAQRNTFRIRDILQVKNEYCLYDFPEKWSEKVQPQDVGDSGQPEQELTSPDNLDPTTSLNPGKDSNKIAINKAGSTEGLKSVTKKIRDKYDQLCKRRNSHRAWKSSARSESTETTKATSVLMIASESNQHQKQSSKSSNAKDNIKDISINILNNQRRSSTISSPSKSISTSSPSKSTSTSNDSRKSPNKTAKVNENQSKENNRLLRKENNLITKNPLNEKKLNWVNPNRKDPHNGKKHDLRSTSRLKQVFKVKTRSSSTSRTRHKPSVPPADIKQSESSQRSTLRNRINVNHTLPAVDSKYPKKLKLESTNQVLAKRHNNDPIHKRKSK